MLRRPGQPVKATASRLKMPDAAASKYLRDLNARGLLKASRTGSAVQYWPSADRLVPQAPALLKALADTFRAHSQPVAFIFRCATAFTHPRRVRMVRILRKQPLHASDLARRAGISTPALMRHLRKLTARGFVGRARAQYIVLRQESPLAATLLRLAEA